jgi:hypothetical protein
MSVVPRSEAQGAFEASVHRAWRAVYLAQARADELGYEGASSDLFSIGEELARIHYSSVTASAAGRRTLRRARAA